MKMLTALELKSRTTQMAPLAVVVTRRRLKAADHCVRLLDPLCDALEVESTCIDADAPENVAWLDMLAVESVPEVLLFHRGACVERCPGFRDEAAAEATLLAFLPSTRSR